MQGDDIREQIEALRQEVRGLSTSILTLRQDDMRKVFGDQIGPVLTDRIQRHFSQAKGKASVGHTERDLLDLVEGSVALFQRDGKQKALRFLDEFERSSVVPGKATDRFVLDILAQIREYLELSDTVFNQTVPESPACSRTGVGRAKFSPEEAERLMAPLSNARRVQVMMILSRENNSLAELSKELDLKKGHLQFHLKALLDAQYIQFDRKSRLYSMTVRGTKALDGLNRLVDSLSD